MTMIHAAPLSGGFPSRLIVRLRQIVAALNGIPHSLIALVARIFAAAIFWQSGQTKLEGWRVSDNAIALFREEYRLPLIDPVIGAYLATIGEHLFPLLLVLGFASRFAALALLGMTAVIQIFVYPDAWPTHGVWAVSLLIILARGPGLFAFDHLIARQWPASK